MKTCPDMVVYVENFPYVPNPWLTDSNGKPRVVNINDFVTSISVTGGVEHAIPNATINLSIPVHLRYLFQAPGGNLILNTMDEVEIYCKGYFMSGDGNSVYYRVFGGIISTFNVTDTFTTLEINMSCDGSLRLMDMSSIAMNPAAGNAGYTPMTPFMNQLGQMTPYQQIQALFVQALSPDIFQFSSIPQIAAGVANLDAIKQGYINRWIAKLRKLSKLVRVFGLKPERLPEAPNGSTNPVGTGTGSAKTEPVKVAPNKKVYKTKTGKPQPEQLEGVALTQIAKYFPSYGIGSLSLLNSNVISRLEAVRTVVEGLDFELFQDFNGDVVIKPPFYNLDVTNLDGSMAAKASNDASTNTYNLKNENNPYIIYASEVESEQETEDQNQIRATRVTARASWSGAFQAMFSSEELLPVGVYTDINLLSKFGLRDVSNKQIGFIDIQHPKGLFAAAAAEMARLNRGYRTYNVTIPIRPEIRLGFPVYFPHKDMFGYPRTITISYTVGGTASMTLACDALRRRPMNKVDVTVNQQSNDGLGTQEPSKQTLYQSIPNLILRWVDSSLSPATPANQAPSDPTLSKVTLGTTTDPAEDFLALRSYMAKKVGTIMEVKADSGSKQWQVQNGDSGFFSVDNTPDHSRPSVSPNPKFRTYTVKGSKNRGVYVDDAYLDLLMTAQPYTDENGYELIGPFPWGRWLSLEAALKDVDTAIITDDDPSAATLTNRISTPGASNLLLGRSSLGSSCAGLTSLFVAQTYADITNPYVSSFELVWSTPEAQESTSSAPETTAKAGEPSPEAKSTMDKIAGMLQTAHTAASGGTGPYSNFFNYRGRLGYLQNDTTWHPNEPSLGNSDLATNLSTAFQNSINDFGSKKVS